MIVNSKKFYQILLWPNCNNNCNFCYQKQMMRDGREHLLDLDEKRKSIRMAIDFLHSDKFEKGSFFLMVGGELFDQPNIFPELYEYIDVIAEMMSKGDIALLYANTNLIYKKLEGVRYLIDKFADGGVCSGMWNKLKFTTSYDIYGRFVPATERLMRSNLDTLHKLYPQLNTTCNIILSKQLCEAVLEDKFNVKEFADAYGCYINLIPYVELDKDMTPSREQVIRALYAVEQQWPGYLDFYIKNFDIRQQRFIYKYSPEGYQYCSSKTSSCGHPVNMYKYSTGGTCFICDILNTF